MPPSKANLMTNSATSTDASPSARGSGFQAWHFFTLLAMIGVVRPAEIMSLVQARRALAKDDQPPPAGEALELGGEIAATPSIIDQASLSGPPKRAE